ncbi:3-oxoacyl-ACP reductase FabG [Flexivirga oryzae]|uniref:3-oxoacyl-[acyl-carrier protein] reductase n=1 Tax=Flexivirga oryzae TaxID=1794944 RepID=A0A839ND54_9MICO|nr:3-oxoacyl-ACP reductase FabG [Flexivirga oryzae]MBB2892472.1 3-oxoacyl-[acyl-carrier protein] reductase [Flexivirga oryzae]
MTGVSFDFTGQTIVVTGAARGIGRELARAFSDAGGTVYVLDHDEAAAASTAAELGAHAIGTDVSSSSSVEAAVARIIDDTGRIDVLVNNAGILRDTVLWKMTDEQWDAVLAVHAGGTFKMTRAVVPTMRAQGFGRIVNTTSYTGLHGNIGQANYATAKAGIIGFTRTAAKELARFGITVNAISPNAETDMVASVPAEKRAELIAAIPAGRFGDPAEMAAGVCFLASRAAGYVTGVVLPIDGGLSI